VETVAYERPPSFVAACLAAAGGHLAASFLVGLAMVPLALVTWTGVVFSGGPPTSGLRLLLPWLLVLAVQPFLGAWIAQHGLELFDAGSVTYARACAAMLLGVLVTAFAAVALPAEAGLPVLGHTWAGALAAAVVLAGQRPAAR
jgi:hypothetical protein